MSVEYDFTDPKIREMIKWDHKPMTVWDSFKIAKQVTCRECRHVWPCPTIKLYRQKKKWWWSIVD